MKYVCQFFFAPIVTSALLIPAYQDSQLSKDTEIEAQNKVDNFIRYRAVVEYG